YGHKTPKENGGYQVHQKRNHLPFLHNRPARSAIWTHRTSLSARTPRRLFPRHQPMFLLQQRMLSTISRPDGRPRPQWLRKFAESASRTAVLVFWIRP